MTVKERSFFTILFTQCTHDACGVRARKRKAKRCIWARNLSFGLLCHSSGGLISDQSKKSELCSVCSENGQLPPRSGIRSSEKTVCLSCVTRVRQHISLPHEPNWGLEVTSSFIDLDRKWVARFHFRSDLKVRFLSQPTCFLREDFNLLVSKLVNASNLFFES